MYIFPRNPIEKFYFLKQKQFLISYLHHVPCCCASDAVYWSTMDLEALINIHDHLLWYLPQTSRQHIVKSHLYANKGIPDSNQQFYTSSYLKSLRIDLNNVKFTESWRTMRWAVKSLIVVWWMPLSQSSAHITDSPWGPQYWKSSQWGNHDPRLVRMHTHNNSLSCPWWCHSMKMLSILLALCEENPLMMRQSWFLSCQHAYSQQLAFMLIMMY